MSVSETTHRVDFVCTPTQPDVDPYRAPGSPGIPSTVARVMDTPEQLSRAIKMVMAYRDLNQMQVASIAGVPQSALAEALDRGTGAIEDIRSILDAIGVEAVTLPGPPALRLRR